MAIIRKRVRFVSFQNVHKLYHLRDQLLDFQR